MARILPLSDLVIGRIAAGEAIARPASVVKELVDNSLDSGATSIQVDVYGGGVRGVRVIDNGSGIAQEDLALALQRHATSKLRTAEDLEHIVTMGFRGEGLASVAASARLTLTSRTADAPHASSITADHGNVQPVKPAAGPVGTVVDVQQLFGQIPARRKFLKSEATEWSHVEDVLRQAALAHPEVAFVWSHNDRVRARYPVSTREQRMAAVMGDALVRAAAPLHAQDDGLNASVHGVLSADGSVPSVLFVNDRPVRDKMVTHALHEAYQQALGRERSGTWCLFLSVDPGSVDVNVHPTKSEVRFREPAALHRFLMRTVTPVLREAFGAATPDTAGGTAPTTITGARAPGAARRADSGEMGLAPGAWYAPWLQARPVGTPSPVPVPVPGLADDAPGGPDTPPDTAVLVPTGSAEPRAVAVLHDRFVVVEHPDGMVLLDRQRVQQPGVVKALALTLAEAGETLGLPPQPLIVPVVVRADGDLDVIGLVEQHRDRLIRWGVDLSPQGLDQVLVRALPALPSALAVRWDVQRAIGALLYRLSAQGEALNDAEALQALAIGLDAQAGLSLAAAQGMVRTVGLDGPGTRRWGWHELDQALG